MSADNGVYILECKDQFRVAHLQAIDNIRWSFIEKQSQQLPVPTRVVEMFGKVKYTRSRDTALRVASAILGSLPVCEYGINYININKRWNTVVREAKDLAIKELESIEGVREWDYEKEQILELLNSQ